MNNQKYVLIVSENALKVSENVLKTNEKLLKTNEELLKIEKEKDPRPIIESFPSTDDVTYDKVTFFTESKLKPWVQRVDNMQIYLEQGKKDIDTPYNGKREFSGRLLDGMLVGRVSTSDGKDPAISGICYRDKLYGTCK